MGQGPRHHGRKKLGDDPANPRYIVNEPGVGYRLLFAVTPVEDVSG